MSRRGPSGLQAVHHSHAATNFHRALHSPSLWHAVEKQQTFAESMRWGAEGAHVRLAPKNAELSRIDLVGALTPFCVDALASSLGVTRALWALVCIQLASALSGCAGSPKVCAGPKRPRRADSRMSVVLKSQAAVVSCESWSVFSRKSALCRKGTHAVAERRLST